VIAGAVSGPEKQPKNEAESDRWLKTVTKSGISNSGAFEGGSGLEKPRYHNGLCTLRFSTPGDIFHLGDYPVIA
jgi:hypothetical protein